MFTSMHAVACTFPGLPRVLTSCRLNSLVIQQCDLEWICEVLCTQIMRRNNPLYARWVIKIMQLTQTTYFMERHLILCEDFISLYKIINYAVGFTVPLALNIFQLWQQNTNQNQADYSLTWFVIFDLNFGPSTQTLTQL